MSLIFKKLRNWMPVALLALGGVGLASCKDDKQIQPPPPVVTDAQLQAIIEGGGFAFYQNKPNDTLASGSPHATLVRVRYNAKAQSVLGADGKLPAGASFPDSSVIVKELYTAKGQPAYRIAIMMKMSTAGNNSSGWVWGYYDYNASAAAGSRFTNVVHSATAEASITNTECVICHKSTGNRDLNLTFRDH